MALVIIDDAPVVQGLDIVRVEGKRAIIAGDGLVQTLQPLQREASSVTVSGDIVTVLWGTVNVAAAKLGEQDYVTLEGEGAVAR